MAALPPGKGAAVLRQPQLLVQSSVLAVNGSGVSSGEALGGTILRIAASELLLVQVELAEEVL